MKAIEVVLYRFESSSTLAVYFLEEKIIIIMIFVGRADSYTKNSVFIVRVSKTRLRKTATKKVMARRQFATAAAKVGDVHKRARP